jgi:manganese-dependent inorganic pyrophosphatase
MYQENNISVSKEIAGMLCAAILSDTLLFRSPTCTALDEQYAKQLAAIAEIDLESFAMEMFEAGSSLRNKSVEELFNQDYKVFQVENMVIGVSQITSINQKELDNVAALMQEYVPQALSGMPIQLSYIMLTNIHNQGSDLLAFGPEATRYAEEAFHATATDNVCSLPGVVSRKKQVVPALVARLQEDL